MPEYQTSLWEKIVAVLLAFMVFGLVAYLIITNKPLREQTAVSLRIFISLAVSIMGATIPGFLRVDLSAKGLRIRAAGALALFVITYFFSPKVAPSLQEENAIPILVDPHPVSTLENFSAPRIVLAAEKEVIPALKLRVALEGTAPNQQQKLYDLTISNSSHEQRILTTFHVRWSYSPGSLSAVEEGISLKPSEKYAVNIPLDVDRPNQMFQEDVALSPAILMPPANESGPTIKTVRLEVNYTFAGRLKYHPNEGWELFYDIAVRDDSGESLTLLRRAWRRDKNDDWTGKFDSPTANVTVLVDPTKRSLCVPPGYKVQLSSRADEGYGVAFNAQLDTDVKSFVKMERIGPENLQVLAIIDPVYPVNFTTPDSRQQGCYEFDIGSFRVDKLPIDNIRGDNWERGDFAQITPANGHRYVSLSGLEHNGQVKVTWGPNRN